MVLEKPKLDFLQPLFFVAKKDKEDFISLKWFTSLEHILHINLNIATMLYVGLRVFKKSIVRKILFHSNVKRDENLFLKQGLLHPSLFS